MAVAYLARRLTGEPVDLDDLVPPGLRQRERPAVIDEAQARHDTRAALLLIGQALGDR